jgi:hypothetical protein|tara:strand:+ start:8529 stop:9362 length:834 start_codon:yes stop_codon:yes gene_type:complete
MFQWNGETGLFQDIGRHRQCMAGGNAVDLGGNHAFSGPLRRARWGIDTQFSRPAIGGVDQQLRYTFSPESSDAEGFITTIKVLQELTSKYVTNPEVVQFTRRLFNHARIRNHDELGEIQALIQYFQGSYTTNTPDEELGLPLLFGDKGAYRYQKDPYGNELFQSPAKVLRDIQAGESGADCDDIAAAAACCLAAAGYPAMLMIVDADSSNPGQFNHVMLATKTLQPNPIFGTDWFPIELIHPFGAGESVQISQYIPLIVEPYDIDRKTQSLIPARFR